MRCSRGWRGMLAHEKQIISHCEMTPRARNTLKSGDPSDQALASLERAAPPSPLQAGAPAWLTPGLLRSPLHHQRRHSCSSRGAYRSGHLRGRRSRPGHLHAGGPRSEGALGGAKHSKDARGRFEGGIWNSRTARISSTPQKNQIPRKPKCSPSVVASRTPQPASAERCP